MREKTQIIIAASAYGAFFGITATMLTLAVVGLFPPTDSTQVDRPLNTFARVDEQVIDLVQTANEAVVNITVSKKISRSVPSNLDVSENLDVSGQLLEVGGGSGFVISEDGLIVTNRHVVEDEDAVYSIVYASGQSFEAQVLAKDPVLDIALLKVDGNNLPTVPLGDSDTLRPGQTVIAIGNALAELGNSVTRGVVSAIGRRVEAGDGNGRNEILDHAIQTDAAINPGNSGGPLLNLSGEVVGINTAISSRGQSVGFAIPINDAKKTIESVVRHGRIIRPWLGVRYVPVTPRLADEMQLPVLYGALIIDGTSDDERGVLPNSPAAAAGLQEGDIILEINGEKLEDKDSLAQLVARHEVGEEIVIRFVRKGEERVLRLILDEFPIN